MTSAERGNGESRVVFPRPTVAKTLLRGWTNHVSGRNARADPRVAHPAACLPCAKKGYHMHAVGSWFLWSLHKGKWSAFRFVRLPISTRHRAWEQCVRLLQTWNPQRVCVGRAGTPPPSRLPPYSLTTETKPSQCDTACAPSFEYCYAVAVDDPMISTAGDRRWHRIGDVICGRLVEIYSFCRVL